MPSLMRCTYLAAAAILLLAVTSVTAASTSSGLSRRALLQAPDWSGGNRPAWFNNDKVQSGAGQNWGTTGVNPTSNWGNPSRPQWPQGPAHETGPGLDKLPPPAVNQGSSQAGGQGFSQPRRQQNPRNRKGDISTLSALTAPTQSLRNVPRQTIAAPTSGPGLGLYQGLRRGRNAKANAQSLAETFNSNSEAAATAVASAATEGGSSSAVAEAVAQTTVSHPSIAPGLLARSADLAVSKGQTQAFAGTMADAFAVSKRGAYVPQFTRSVTDAISRGGPSTKLAYGEAIATAIAQGGDSKAAVAEATATAFCEGGSTAQSWASAYAIALSKDASGCLVLNEAKAMAQARCGAGASEAFSKAEATSMVLGFCGLLDMIPDINYNFSGGNSGSNSWSP